MTKQQKAASNNKPTTGEELWQVHLHRTAEDVYRDRDHEQKATETRKRSASLGDELWQIHCRRSQGVDLERDEEKPEATAKSPPKKREKKPPVAHVIHLRNRDVPAAPTSAVQ